jgi:hypothetical protein
MTIEQKLKELEIEFKNKIADLREEALKEEEFKVGDWVLVQGNIPGLTTGNGIIGIATTKLYDLEDPSFPNGGGRLRS